MDAQPALFKTSHDPQCEIPGGCGALPVVHLSGPLIISEEVRKRAANIYCNIQCHGFCLRSYERIGLMLRFFVSEGWADFQNFRNAVIIPCSCITGHG